MCKERKTVIERCTEEAIKEEVTYIVSYKCYTRK